MKIYNHLYKDENSFADYIESIQIDREKQLLIRIHSSIHSVKQIEKLAANIRKTLPKACIIGCSTSQIICEGKIISNSCLVSIAEFENCHIDTAMLDCKTESGKWKSGKRLGMELADKLIKNRSGLLLAFFPFAYTKTSKVVDIINRKCSNVQMMGGGAYFELPEHAKLTSGGRSSLSDSEKDVEEYAYVLINERADRDSAAFLFVTSDELYIYENFICGVEAVGKSYEITQTHKNYMDSVENEDAAGWYSGILGAEELEKEPTLSNVFPIVHIDDFALPYFVNYEKIGTKKSEDHRLALYTELEKGMNVSVGYFNPQKILEEMQEVYRQMKKKPVEGLFVYDCQARRCVLHNCANWEVGQFYTTNMSGALLSGEISYSKGKNIYMNYSFAITGISERKEARIPLRSRDIRNAATLQQDNMHMVNYLLMVGNKTLSEQVKKDRERMENSMLYHEAMGIYNQMKYLIDRENEKLDKVAVFSLKNEKMLKIFIGRKEIYSELSSVYNSINEKIKEYGIRMYCYEDVSLLLAADEGVPLNTFISKMQEICSQLNQTSCQDVKLSVTCAVVSGEEKPLEKIENAIKYAQSRNLSFVKYNDISKLVRDSSEEIKMLQILRDVLANERVTPVFQGIYNNETKKIDLYEALIRIEDADGKIYCPSAFLDIAKEYNLYESLSIIMVKKVLEMFADREERVSINLNVRDVYNRKMIKVLFYYMRKVKHPENFVFELVESEEVTDYEYMKKFADRIHACGAKIAIDDFGSGFSNLLHIIRIEADYLKIDGEIIRIIDTDDSCMGFVSAINEWCKSQNKEIIAEYVENKSIQNIMEQIGISYSQGYYFSKPERWEKIQG